jgi:hypothetical protein
MTVYIPTLSRAGNMMKVVPAWLQHDIPVRLVVERDQYDDYARLRDEQSWDRVKILKLPKLRQGIGNTRRLIVEHAAGQGLKSIIMSDDDMHPKPGTNMRMLLDSAQDHRVLGIGAVRGIHDRFTGGAITRNSGIIICTGGWGNQLFALNVTNVLALGNFKPCFRTFLDDNDMNMCGIAAGYPWLVHCDVWSVGFGTDKAPGGNSAVTPDRAVSDEESRAILASFWPKYVSRFSQRHRVSWRRMLDDHIPGWRDRSALDNGRFRWDGTPL